MMSMFQRDVIVVGASLGGIEALTTLMGSLPADLPAAILVVLHMDQASPGRLSSILNKQSRIPFAKAVEGEEITAGRGYVAVPGRHLMIQDGCVRLSSGPRESHARPSIDVLFRSAAHEFDRRVIGIILTGMLDDGTAGLWAIKDRGGIAIVQSPQEAPYPSMPNSALRHVKVDYTLRIEEMGPVLDRLTSESLVGREMAAMEHDDMETEVGIAAGKVTPQPDFSRLGVQSFFTCPQCHGSMIRIDEDSNQRFRCHTGHAFGEITLEHLQAMSIESTLMQALALIEEREKLLRDVVQRAREKGRSADSEEILNHAVEVRQLGDELRELIERPVARKTLGTDPPKRE